MTASIFGTGSLHLNKKRTLTPPDGGLSSPSSNTSSTPEIFLTRSAGHKLTLLPKLDGGVRGIGLVEVPWILAEAIVDAHV